MKTTLEISDPLWHEARALAARDGDTFRSLVEQGLRHVVQERRAQYKVFRLQDGSVGGDGLTPEFRDATHDEWLAAVYGDRGG